MRIWKRLIVTLEGFSIAREAAYLASIGHYKEAKELMLRQE